MTCTQTSTEQTFFFSSLLDIHGVLGIVHRKIDFFFSWSYFLPKKALNSVSMGQHAVITAG